MLSPVGGISYLRNRQWVLFITRHPLFTGKRQVQWEHVCCKMQLSYIWKFFAFECTFVHTKSSVVQDASVWLSRSRLSFYGVLGAKTLTTGQNSSTTSPSSSSSSSGGQQHKSRISPSYQNSRPMKTRGLGLMPLGKQRRKDKDKGWVECYWAGFYKDL